MTKPDGIPKDASAAAVSPWGTWEDLLLAFAVNRHGPDAWDSVAAELHKRISVSPTAIICRNKYLDLRRRFLPDDSKSDGQISSLLLDELRKLRVAELRREVRRYDLNIESLELKVKKMEEERERSLEREKSAAADLTKEGEEKTEATTPETPAGEKVAGEEFDKDQLSVNESNSTDPDAEKLRKGEKESEPDRRTGDEAEHDRTGGTSEELAGLKPEPGQKSGGREDSCNGSSNSIEKSERKAAKAEAANSSRIVESEAESNGGGEAATKENSDVQSSASRSRKEEEDGGSDKLRRGSTSGDGLEHEDQSRAVKQLSTTESQPLVGFLQAIKAHKFGSVFQRRLRSQESSKYQKVILQHIDLGVIESRVKEGFYSGSTVKFFRDLLLLVNNAHVFFGKNSSEANAATEIRWLISKEISQKQAKSDSSSGKHASLQSVSLTKKEEPELSRSLMLKPLIVCRKRSSIAAKASSTSSDKKKETPDEKEATPQQSQSNTEEPKITKKRTRDSFPSVPTSTKKTGKNQYTAKNAAASESSKPQPGKGGLASTSTSSPQPTENKNTTSSESKKRGAANFLNRIKQGGSGSSNNSVLLDALKNTPLTSESSSGKGGGGGSEQKKTESKKKEVVSKKSKEKEKSSSAAKRNVGRPPKRAAAPPAATGKRNREEEETEATPPAKQPKKRSRKL